MIFDLFEIIISRPFKFFFSLFCLSQYLFLHLDLLSVNFHWLFKLKLTSLLLVLSGIVGILLVAMSFHLIDRIPDTRPIPKSGKIDY